MTTAVCNVNLLNEASVIQLEATGIRSSLEKAKKEQPPTGVAELDWSGHSEETHAPGALLKAFWLGSKCPLPQSLAVDGRDLRFFVACSDRTIAVVNADTGELVTTVPTGSGTGMITYDAPHGLLFAANGDVGGSLTVIERHVTDTYDVIQTLPTTNRARVVAVNSQTGDVYLASDAAQAGTPAPQGSNPKTAKRPSTFHILVIGH